MPGPDALTDALAATLDAATANVAAGGGPFGALVLGPAGERFTGVNQVTGTPPDPTAHAEIVAIRAAAAGLGTFDLSSCVLVSSCQPCPMCLAAALWAHLSRIVYAATASDAAAAGFDDEVFATQLRGGIDTVTQAQIVHLDAPDRHAPFHAWAARPDRIRY